MDYNCNTLESPESRSTAFASCTSSDMRAIADGCASDHIRCCAWPACLTQGCIFCLGSGQYLHSGVRIKQKIWEKRLSVSETEAEGMTKRSTLKCLTIAVAPVIVCCRATGLPNLGV